MSEFEGRLDTKLLGIDHADVVSREVSGLDDDSDITLLFKVNQSLSEEAISWLKANQLTYTDVECDFQKIVGTHRTTSIAWSDRLQGVVQGLKKGYYTSLDWDAARIVSDRLRPAGTNTTLTGGDEQERYIIFEFPYIAQGSENELVNSMPETKDDFSEVPSGTWYLIDATSLKQEDGTFTIQALYANTSIFAIEGKNSKDVPSGSRLIKYTGVPKQLAQSFCDLYTSTGDTVVPTYTSDGLVNITVEKSDYTAITLSGVKTEDSCRFSVSTTYYFGIATLPALPTHTTGIKYRMGGVYLDRNGRYNCYIEATERVPQALDSIDIEASARRTTSQVQNLGTSSLTAISSEQGHVKSKSVRVNDDCTYDETINDTLVIDQAGSGARKSADATSEVVTHTSSTEIDYSATPAQGVRKVVSSEPTEEDRFRTSEETTTSISRQTENLTSDINYNRSTARVSGRNLRNADLTSYALSASPTIGIAESRIQSDNEDGTFNVRKDTTTSTPHDSYTDKVVETTLYSETTESLSKNQTAAPVDISPAEGITRERVFGTNEDGSLNIRTVEREVDEIVSTANTTVSKNEALETLETKSENILSVDIAGFNIPALTAGQSATLSRRRNVDGTYNATLSVEEETDQTATSGGASDLYRETYQESVDEERHTGNTAPLDDVSVAEGVITQTESTPKANGLYRTIKRIITSIPQTMTSYASQLSAAYTRNRTVGKNIRSASLPTVEYEEGKIKSYTKTLLADNTYDYELIEEVVEDQSGVLKKEALLETVASSINTEGDAITDITGDPVAGTIKRIESRPNASGKFSNVQTTETASAFTGTQQNSSASALYAETRNVNLNKSAPTNHTLSGNEIISGSHNVNRYGLYDETYTIRTPETDVGNFSTGAAAGGDAFSTKELFVGRNLASPAISAVSNKIVEGRADVNEYGLWDVKKTIETPTAVSSSSSVTLMQGLIKATTQTFYNQPSAPAASAIGTVYSNVRLNAFGKYDYSLTTYTPNGSVSYSYYGPDFTSDESTYTAYEFSVDDAGGTPRSYYRYLLTNPLKTAKKWQYSVTMQAHSTAASAQAAITSSAVQGSGISVGAGGLFISKLVTKTLVAA